MSFYFGLVAIFFLLFAMAQCRRLEGWQRRVLQACPFILLFFVSIFAFDVGFDYFAYYEIVADVTAEGAERFEPLSYCLVQLARYWGEPYTLFILFGIPTYLPVFWFCRKTGHSKLAFWTFVFLFWLNTFGIIRQAAAMGMILCAIGSMLDKKPIPYILLCVLASLFHLSSLVMLPVYFIYHHCSWKIVLGGVVALIIFFQAVVSILLDNGIYTAYLDGDGEFEGGTLIRFFYIGLGGLLLFLSYKNKTLATTKQAFTVLFPAYFFPLMFGGAMGGRISMYFYLLFLYLIPVVLSHCGKQLRMLFMLMLCAYFFLLLYVSSQNPVRSPYVPYQHIFEVDLEHPKFR